MSNRIKFEGMEEEELKKRISKEIKIPKEQIAKEHLEFLENFVKEKGGSFKKEKKILGPDSDDDMLGYLIPKTYYHLNVKKTTWMLAGLLLDLLLTKGGASVVLAALGKSGKVLAKCHPENGEICIYLTARNNTTESFKAEDIYQLFKDNKCIYGELNCRFRKGEDCRTSRKEIRERLHLLQKKNVFVRNNKGNYEIAK